MNGRAHRAAKFDADTRLQLLEEDVDKLEAAVNDISSQMRKLTNALIGAALTFGVASVMFAVNLAST
jgi:hypothetical protein